ncbi:MAG TPA: zf-HC2 domain-containing protein, partial [Bacteroidota bacterium]|nr:zf-HC2 domain-containing protein [Bacteroidota bacterium]
MKGCRQIESSLHLYREGELTQEEAKELRAHLDGCPSCSRVLRELRNLDDALQVARTSGEAPAADPSIVESTMEFIRRNSRGGGRSAHRPGSPVFLAGAFRPAIGFALLFAALLLAYQQGRDAWRLT